MTLTEAYRILGVDSGADLDDIKAAYRRLVVQAHPDQGGDTNDFIRIQAAYELICAAREEHVDRDEVPIPDELRIIIDRIVADFRAQRDAAHECTLHALASLHDEAREYIARASRKDLRLFGQQFNRGWNQTISTLFGSFNQGCDEALARYDQWFHGATGTTLGYKRTEKPDRPRRKRSRFTSWKWLLVWGVLLAVFGKTLGAPPVGVVVLFLAPLVVGSLRWLGSPAAGGVARRAREMERMRVDLFQLDRREEFLGSMALRVGHRDTVAAGVGGFILGDLLTEGIAGPLVGALLGGVLGGAIDRLRFPTNRIRRLLLEEVEQFMAMARREVPAYVIWAHEQALAELRGRVEANFRDRVWRAAKMITAGTPRT